MMNLIKYIFLLFIPCLLASCVGKVFSDANSSELSTAPITVVSETKIASDFELQFPKQIKVIGDSLIAIIDPSQGDEFAHLIRINGDYVACFGKIGQGPGEFLTPDKLSVNNEGKLYIYDFRLCNSGVFHTDSLLSGTVERKKIRYENIMPEGVLRFNSVIHQSDSDFIGFCLNEINRIILVRNGKLIDSYNNYPQLDDNSEFNTSLWNNGACFSASPDGKHIVIGTSIGMAFEIFDIKDDKISSRIFKEFYKPIFTVAEGAVPVCVTYAEDCPVGFKTICATNEDFYGVIGGSAPDYEDANIIYRFDYNGKLIDKFKCKFQIDALDVNEEAIYALSYDEDGNYFITKIDK